MMLSSTFSDNILTFKEDEPVRASLQYQIQPNLDSASIEKVQRAHDTIIRFDQR